MKKILTLLSIVSLFSFFPADAMRRKEVRLKKNSQRWNHKKNQTKVLSKQKGNYSNLRKVRSKKKNVTLDFAQESLPKMNLAFTSNISPKIIFTLTLLSLFGFVQTSNALPAKCTPDPGDIIEYGFIEALNRQQDSGGQHYPVMKFPDK